MVLALSLTRRGIPVAIIEKNKKSKLSNINDLRTSAISQGSSRILTNLNIWNKIGNKAQLINSILVKDGKIIAEGWHDHLGGLHAEQMSIHDAEENGHITNGAAAYVTLEPCNHFGSQLEPKRPKC